MVVIIPGRVERILSQESSDLLRGKTYRKTVRTQNGRRKMC